MTRYARESSEYLRRMGFDGLDVDWEFPKVSWNSKGSDRARFTSLLKVCVSLSNLLMGVDPPSRIRRQSSTVGSRGGSSHDHQKGL